MKELLNKLVEVNSTLRKPNGMFVASNGPHYCNFSWIRDIYYQAKPSLKLDPEAYKQTYQTLTNYYLGLDEKYDNKMQWLVDAPQVNSSCFIHPRFNWEDLSEITSNWGNIQLDTFGYYLLAISEGVEKGIEIKGAKDVCIKLIKILDSIEFWKIEDNAIWEENEEIHASSIGAVLGGLISFVCVVEPGLIDDMMVNKLIDKAEFTLKNLLPCETKTKSVDLALLTLIYPFNAVSSDMARKIISNVTKELERSMGVIRYHGDAYYSNSIYGGYNERIGEECEWCMGFAFLAHAHKQLGNHKDSEKYFKKMVEIHKYNDENGLPEGYYSKSKDANCNSTLGWPTGMMIDYINKYKL
ncbi:MAG: glycoside hydrolase family 15 protein [Candidatus Heimdallarchaeaceae archaeon]